MALYTIRIGGSSVAYVHGRTSVSTSASSPAGCSFVLIYPTSATLPVIGQSVVVEDKNGNRVFGGSIDEVQKKLIEETSTELEVTITASGYDNRLHVRTTFDGISGKCAQYRSYHSVVNVSGTSCVWSSGDKFSPDFSGVSTVGELTVNGSAVHATVTDPDHCTLSSGLGTLTGVDLYYKVYSGDIVKDLLDTYCQWEGFTYDGSSIQQGAQIQQVVFDPPVPVYDAIQTILGFNDNFYFAVDPHQKCYFAVRTLIPAPKDFTVSSGSYKRGVTVIHTREDVRNSEVNQTNWNAVQPIIDTINGDGSKKSWFLSERLYELVSVKLNGVDVTAVGDDASTGNDYYYRKWDYAFWQDVGTPVLGIGDVLEVSYKKASAYLMEYEDTTAESSRRASEGGGSGKYSQVVDRSTLQGKTDALLQSQDSISRMKDDLVKVSLETLEEQYLVGQSVVFNLPDYQENLTMFIDQITVSDSNCAGSGDLIFTLTMVSVSRRVTGAAVLRELFQTTANAGSGGGGVASVVVSGAAAAAIKMSVTLTDPATTIVGPTVVEGQILVVILTQPGDCPVAWDGSFVDAPLGIDRSIGSKTIVTFVGDSGQWLMTSYR